MIIATVVLVVWAIVLKAPLEQPATSAKAPNPSKAPWYFLGLQEMLVYFDPWMAGVVLPTMIIVGLIAMPYIDFNHEGQRLLHLQRSARSRSSTFLFGFLVLWVVLIVLGTFLRGPELELLRPVRVLGPAQGRAAEQRQPLGHLLAGNMLGQPLEGMPIVCMRELPGIVLVLALPVRSAAAAGQDGVAHVLHQDGLRPLLHAGDAAPVHGRAADQDGAALDAQPEVHRRTIPEYFFNI